MSTSLMSLGGGGSATDYITKKEKLTSALITAGVVGAGIFFLGPVVLPSILGTLGLLNAVVGSTLALGIKLALAAGIGFVALQPRTWTLVWHLNNMLARKMGRFIFTMDPTGRLEAFANEYLAGRRAKVIEAFTKVTAVQKANQHRLGEYLKKIAKAEETALALLRMSYRNGQWANDAHADEYRRISQPIDMWRETAAGIERYVERTDLQLKQLDKWRKGFDYYIEATHNIVEDTKTRYELSRSMAEATGAISESMDDGDMKRFFEQNIDFLNNEIARYDAEVEVAMAVLPELNKSYDVRNDVAEDKLTQRLLELDRKADVMLEGAAKAAGSLTSGAPTTTPQQMGRLAQAQEAQRRSLLTRR